MARQFLNITYPSLDHPDFKKVLELVKEHKTYKSDIGRRLVHKGLEHINNPEPLFGAPKTGSPGRRTQSTRTENQGVSPVNTSRAVEHVSGNMDLQKPSRDKGADVIADRSTGSAPELDKKKSLNRGSDNTGLWVVGLVVAGLAIWKWCTR